MNVTIHRRYVTVTTETEQRDVSVDELISITDASKYHDVSIPAVTDWIAQGELAYVTIDDEDQFKRPKRWLLRSEVETFIKPSDRTD